MDGSVTAAILWDRRVPELHRLSARFFILGTVAKGGDAMRCHTPECGGEHETRAISHAVIYQERTFVVHGVPADVCPECGEAVLSEETTLHLEALLRRKARGKGTAFPFEI